MFLGDEIRPIADHIGIIRTHPEMFLPEGRVSGETLALQLISDILIQPYRLAIALRVDAWWIVASDEDWISSITSDMQQRDPFTQIVAFPEAGQNSMHAEIVITAFAKDVFTFAGLREQKVKGERDDNLLLVVGQHPEWRRCVAFRF